MTYPVDKVNAVEIMVSEPLRNLRQPAWWVRKHLAIKKRGAYSARAINLAKGEHRHSTKGTENIQNTPQDYDEINNVQQTVWENAPLGKATVTIGVCALGIDEIVKYALTWSLE